MNIGIDLMGGDSAPELPLKMVLELQNNPTYSSHQFHCFGTQKVLEPTLNKPKLSPCYCSSDIPSDFKNPKEILSKQDSSIYQGLLALQKGEIDVFLSAGNTGAIVVAAKFLIPVSEGITRPCLAIKVPKVDGTFGLLVDVGANVDVKPEHLSQFAQLGMDFASKSLGISKPSLGLINIGSEPYKGDKLRQIAFKNLNTQFPEFIGNIEGWEIFDKKADVMVCDGFTGNVVLKLSEGFAQILLKQDKKHPFLNQFRMENHGGSFLLGYRKPIIIGHGSSNQSTLENMLKLAIQF